MVLLLVGLIEWPGLFVSFVSIVLALIFRRKAHLRDPALIFAAIGVLPLLIDLIAGWMKD